MTAIALSLGMDVKIIKLPPGVDPADMLRDTPDVFKEAAKQALHVVDFYLEYVKDAKYDPRTFKREVSRTVLPYVAMVVNGIDRAHFVKRVAEALGVPEDVVASEVEKVKRVEIRDKSPHSQLSTLNSQLAPAEPFLSRLDMLERLVSGLCAAFRERGEAEEAQRAKEALKKMGSTFPEDAGEIERPALFEADLFLEQYQGDAEKRKALDELYADLLKESAHGRYRETLAALRAAEAAHDEARAEALLKELSRLAGELQGSYSA